MEIRQVDACPPHYCPECDGVVHSRPLNRLWNAYCAGSYALVRDARGQQAMVPIDGCGWSAQYTKEPQ